MGKAEGTIGERPKKQALLLSKEANMERQGKAKCLNGNLERAASLPSNLCS
jgi:hypothetical protein